MPARHVPVTQDPLMDVRLLRRLAFETAQGVVGPAALEGDARRHA
jgi:hypothetical protein